MYAEGKGMEGWQRQRVYVECMASLILSSQGQGSSSSRQERLTLLDTLWTGAIVSVVSLSKFACDDDDTAKLAKAKKNC